MVCASVFGAVLACPVAAQSVLVCDADTQLGLIAFPEDENIRHFANGAVMLAVVDDGRDDAATALSILVLSPPLDDHGARQCRRVSATSKMGYAALILDTAVASYNPATGLTVTLPGVVVPNAESLGDNVLVSVTVNQATGQITPRQEADDQ